MSVLNSLERKRLGQSAALNQRGERRLGVIGLAKAASLDVQMKALSCSLMGRGVSFASGALPSGAGETTVRAAFLGLLPPGVETMMVGSDDVIANASASGSGRRCHLVHKIGAGHLCGSIWSRAVGGGHLESPAAREATW